MKPAPRGMIIDTLPEPVDIVVTSGGGYPLDQTRGIKPLKAS